MKIVIAYTAIYAAACAAASFHVDILAAVLLTTAAVGVFVYEYLRTGNVLNLRGLFTLGFTGGQGLSCLKLSYLQTEWNIKTWAAFFLAWAGIYFGYDLCRTIIGRYDKKRGGKVLPAVRPDRNRLFICIIALTAVNTAAFILEAAVLGYIPLFVRGVPHAYSEFHISGVHYFTVSSVLVPAFVCVWADSFREEGDGPFSYLKRLPVRQTAVMIICMAAGYAIPLLCVSRFQFAFAMALQLFTILLITQNSLGKEKRVYILKLLVISAAVLLPAYLLLSAARSHDAEYLNSIFEMRYDLPIFISHPYIYIANNYDNFNCLVNELPEHTWGLRMLFPVWALTGLKFIRPELVNFPIFVTKTELTTVTLFYDAYYDFGLAGVLGFALFIGILLYCAERLVWERDDRAAVPVYAQLGGYMALAFFTTWFSNPTTWFYLGVSMIIYVICVFMKGRK